MSLHLKNVQFYIPQYRKKQTNKKSIGNSNSYMTHIKPKSVKHSFTLFEYFKCNQNMHLTAPSIRGPVYNFSATKAMKSFVRFFSVFLILSRTNIFNTDAAKCKKVQFVGLVDCSDLGLTKLPKIAKDINVKVLDHRKTTLKQSRNHLCSRYFLTLSQ